MNNKGQALIEFVLILPVFIFILFAVIDFGRIFYEKINLENDILDIVVLYNNGTSLSKIKTLYTDNNIIIDNSFEYNKFTISVSIDLITPGFNRIFGDPYLISVERIVPNA